MRMPRAMPSSRPSVSPVGIAEQELLLEHRESALQRREAVLERLAQPGLAELRRRHRRAQRIAMARERVEILLRDVEAAVARVRELGRLAIASTSAAAGRDAVVRAAAGDARDDQARRRAVAQLAEQPALALVGAVRQERGEVGLDDEPLREVAARDRGRAPAPAAIARQRTLISGRRPAARSS
jgi:hypothetical protein